MQIKRFFFTFCLLWAVGLFNSHAQTYTLDVQAEIFYTTHLERLDSIRVMSNKEKGQLREYFVSYLLNNADLKWSLQLAMSRVTTYPLYYLILFKEDIIAQANRQTAIDIYEFRTQGYENDSCYRKFIPTIRRKNEDVALIKKIYTTNDSLSSIKQEQVLHQYELQKKNFILSHPHFSKNYNLALKSWRALQLNNSQIDSITICGKELKGFLIKNSNYDYWKHERTHLRSILTEKQYDTFLMLKHRPQAIQTAHYYWRTLKEKNLAADMDSIRTIRDITDYYVERSKLFDQYAYDDREKYKSLFGELYRNFCPVAVRRVNEMLNAEKNTQKSYQGTYAW